MKVGDKVKVTKRKEGKNSYALNMNKRLGTIHSIDKYKITVEYLKDGKPAFRESYNQSDVIENIVIIECRKGKTWESVTKECFSNKKYHK